jgi:hypothetical protein
VSENRPKLTAVGSEPKPAETGPGPSRRSDPDAPGARRATWLLAALLLLACLALVIQTRRVGALSGEVSRLSTDLMGARTTLTAYEGRLATVREVVGDLSRRVGQLDVLVRRDPLAPVGPEDLEAIEPPLAPETPPPDAP